LADILTGQGFQRRTFFTFLFGLAQKETKSPRAGETHSTPAQYPPACYITAHGLSFISARDGVMLLAYILSYGDRLSLCVP
jgi:hypothetical protein